MRIRGVQESAPGMPPHGDGPGVPFTKIIWTTGRYQRVPPAGWGVTGDRGISPGRQPSSPSVASGLLAFCPEGRVCGGPEPARYR